MKNHFPGTTRRTTTRLAHLSLLLLSLACSISGGTAPDDTERTGGDGDGDGDAGGDGDTTPLESEVLGPDGGTVAIESAKVVVPRGALDDDVNVSVARLSSVEAGELPAADLQGVTLRRASAVYAFLPHGTQFEDPVEIAFDTDPDAVVVLTLDDPDDDQWDPVFDAFLNGSEARVQTDHFSYYAAFSVVDDGVEPETDVCGQACPEGGQIPSCNGEEAACWTPSVALFPEDFRFGSGTVTTSYAVDLDDPDAPTYFVWKTSNSTGGFPTAEEYRIGFVTLSPDGTVGAAEVTEPFLLTDKLGQPADLAVRGIYPASGGYLLVGLAGFDRLALLYLRSGGSELTVHELVPEVSSELPHGWTSWEDIPLDHWDFMSAKSGGEMHLLWRLQDPDFFNDSRYDTYHRFSIPLTGYTPTAGTSYTVSTTETSNPIALSESSALDLSPQAVARGPAGRLAVYSHGTDGTMNQDPVQHLAVLDIEAGTLVAEERVDALSNPVSGALATESNCSFTTTGGSTGPAVTFLDLSQATVDSGISGAGLLLGQLGTGDAFSYVTTAAGNSGALVRSSCTEPLETEANLHSPIGALFAPEGDLAAFTSVSVNYSDLSSGAFTVVHTSDYTTNEVSTWSGWSERHLELSVSTLIPTPTGLRLIGSRYQTFEGRRLFTLDLDTAGNYASPLPPL